MQSGGDADGLSTAERVARYRWAAQIVSGRTVLDAGCGSGHGARILAEAGATTVTACDVDAAAAELARRQLPAPANATVADLTDLPFDSAAFDVVVCFEVLEHLDAPEAAIAELRRVLRPDGLLLISTRGRAGPRPDDPGKGRALTLGDFDRLLRSQFPTVILHAQRSWLGSILEPLRPGPDRDELLATRWQVEREPAPALFHAAVASAEPTVAPRALAVLADPFDLDRWSEALREAQLSNERLEAAAARTAEVEQLVRSMTERLEEAELANARIPDLERHLEEAERIVRTFERSLLGRIGRTMHHLRTILR